MPGPVSADIGINIKRTTPISDEDLENVAEEVLDAIENHASDVALGAVVGVNLADRTINVRFCIDASDRPQVSKQMTRVVEAIDGVLQPADTMSTRTSTSARPGELALA